MCVFRFLYTFLILRVIFRDIIINVFRSSCEVPVTLSGFGAVVVSVLVGLWYPRSRVQTRPKPSDFSGEKILSTLFFGGGSKVVCPMSQICGMLKTSEYYVEVGFSGEIYRPFLACFLSSLPESSHVAWRGAPLELTGGTKGGAQRVC
jgi:hypothetical protein